MSADHHPHGSIRVHDAHARWLLDHEEQKEQVLQTYSQSNHNNTKSTRRTDQKKPHSYAARFAALHTDIATQSSSTAIVSNIVNEAGKTTNILVIATPQYDEHHEGDGAAASNAVLAEQHMNSAYSTDAYNDFEEPSTDNDVDQGFTGERAGESSEALKEFLRQTEEKQETLSASWSSSSSPNGSPSSTVRYKRYTLTDYKSLPCDVPLGSLGSNVDPDWVQQHKEKKNKLKQLEQTIRINNRNKVLAQATTTTSAQSDRGSKPTTQQKQQPIPSKRAIALEFAKSVKPPKVKQTVADARAKQTSHSNMHQQTKKATISKEMPTLFAAMPELLRKQEAERQKVQQIRASMGLK